MYIYIYIPSVLRLNDSRVGEEDRFKSMIRLRKTLTVKTRVVGVNVGVKVEGRRRRRGREASKRERRGINRRPGCHGREDGREEAK